MIFSFEILFSSNKSEESAMDVRAYMIGVVKINTRGLWKETIEKLTMN